MKFTRLTLHGFKSFSDATELFLEPGLSGVVGPNGCGKSNLVEALRWVMGESSYKAMRAAGMDDVIATFFKTQDQWVASDKPNDAIFAIAQQLGFTKESYDAALTNQTLYTGLEAVQKQALDEFKLQGTPTFYINGKMLTGESTLEALKAEIDPLLV